jgi:DNA-binding transcriptional regulator YiaG
MNRFKELRLATGMNQTKFAEYFGIPRRTVQNWDLGLRQCPDYLVDLMEYKLRNEKVL